MLSWVLLGLLILFFSIQCFYYLFYYSRIAFHKEPFAPQSNVPVSVVVCARSEAKNIMELVPLLMEQQYPEFEVLVVNDRSWDDTKDILEALKIKYPALRMIHIEENERHHFSGKKMAITLGIKGATYEHLVFTDADCRPDSTHWLMYVASKFSNEKQIILGYSPYKKLKGMLNRLIRFDAFQVAMNYFSCAKAGMPYMGVGRNMAYTKTIHFAKGGFKSHYHIASGDDDLFVNQNANRQNTAVVLHPDSHVTSLPKTSFLEWKRQKSRHMTTSAYYKTGHKLFIGLYNLSLLGFYVMIPLELLLNNDLLISLTFFGVRTVMQILIFRLSAKWLGNKGFAFAAPFLELVMFFINLIFYFRSFFAKREKWI